MSSKTTAPVTTPKTTWTTPTLNHRGSVGQVLLGGGGKLSISGADPGEMRCQKPAASQCA